MRPHPRARRGGEATGLLETCGMWWDSQLDPEKSPDQLLLPSLLFGGKLDPRPVPLSRVPAPGFCNFAASDHPITGIVTVFTWDESCGLLRLSLCPIGSAPPDFSSLCRLSSSLPAYSLLPTRLSSHFRVFLLPFSILHYCQEQRDRHLSAPSAWNHRNQHWIQGVVLVDQSHTLKTGA